MNIDRDVVLHIAKLANIELQDTEIELFTKQLGDILHYIETLDELEQDAATFSYGNFLPAVTRPDIPQPSLPYRGSFKKCA